MQINLEAIKRSPEFDARKAVAWEIERVLGMITHDSVLEAVGFIDVADNRTKRLSIRKNSDPVIYHYLSYGAERMPAIESGLPTMCAWVFLFLYAVGTRGNLSTRQLGSACSKLMEGDNIIKVTTLLMGLVRTPSAWKEHKMYMLQIMSIIDLKYVDGIPFDGQDLLVMANLFGFGPAALINIEHSKDCVDEQDRSNIAGVMPPAMLALLPECTRDLLVKAITINRANLRDGVNRYVGVTQADDKTRDMIKTYLQVAGKVSYQEDPLVGDTIFSFMQYMRRSTLSPIPVKTDKELVKVFKRVLGINLHSSEDDAQEASILTITSLLAISLSPKEKVYSLN